MEKIYNLNNVKYELVAAVKDAGMTPAEVAAIAAPAGRMHLTDEKIAEVLASKGWTAGGPVGGTMTRVKDGSYVVPTDLLAAKDLLNWMLGK